MRLIEFHGKLPTDNDIPNWEPWTKEEWQKWLDESERLLKELNDRHVNGNLAARNKLIDDNSDHWGKLKPWLLALSGGKCWFSEAKDIYSHMDVEHFRPKKEAKNLDHTARDGYWWLAFDYANFRVCGNVGNRKKGGWFPLKKGSLVSCYENQCEESEDYYLLDPIDPEDVTLIAFDEQGNIIPAPGVSDWEKQRVEVTIERLKLNAHEALTEERMKVWKKITFEIESYFKAKSRCVYGINPAAKQKLRDHVSNIRAMTCKDAELSSVAKWCVLFRNDPKLTSLLA